MSGNRHVPLIMGVASIGIAIWLVFGFSGWWRYIPATLLFMFSWPSLKTAFFASDKEIEELTGMGSMSEETRKKFEDRMNPVFLFTASGPLLGAAGWLLSLSWLFWIGVALCAVILFLNMASGVMKLPILPVAFMAGAAAFFSPWYVGLGVGLVAWIALESAGEIIGFKKEGRL